MLLNVGERIQLLGILPNEGDFSTLKIIRRLQDELSFSEDEIKETELIYNSTTYQYGWKKNVDKDFTFGEKATDIIKGSFKKLNEQKKIPIQLFDLYERFMPREELEQKEG